MKSIVVVDDEILVRVGFRALHDWESSGYTIVGEASSVREALPLIEQTRPDIVLTDLVMTPDDGFVLIRRLKERKDPAKVVILSCRNDFEAVRTALREGADDYVFKLTMQAPEMLEVFAKVLDRSRSTGGSTVSPTSAPASLPRYTDPEALKDALGPAAACVSGPGRYRVLRLEDAAPRDRSETAFDTLPRLLAELSRRDLPRFHLWLGGPGSLVCLIEEGALEAGDRLFEAFWEYAFRYAGLSFQGGLSAAHRSLAQFSVAWREAEGAAGQSYRSGKPLCSHEQMPELRDLDWGKLYQALEDFRFLLPSLDSLKLQEEASKILRGLRDCRVDAPTVVQVVWDLLVPLRERLAGLHASGDSDESLLRGLDQLKTCRSLPESEVWAAAWIDTAVARVRTVEAQRYRPEISATVAWLEARLAEPVTVEEAARQARMSESHFAHVFKEETGMSFLKYVIRRKMDLASRLLQTTEFLVYEVALKVGYENANHFSSLFKQTTGLSPQELRAGRGMVAGPILPGQLPGRPGPEPS